MTISVCWRLNAATTESLTFHGNQTFTSLNGSPISLLPTSKNHEPRAVEDRAVVVTGFLPVVTSTTSPPITNARSAVRSGARIPSARWAKPYAVDDARADARARGPPGRRPAVGAAPPAVAHAAPSARPPPVIATPSSSSLAVGGNSPTISPSYMTRIRSESERISSSSSETSRIAAALVALLDQAAVDELDRADVEAARRLRGDQDLRVAVDLAREDDLLLVAAGEAAGARRRPAAADVELLDQRPARSIRRRGKSQPNRESGALRKSWSAMFSAIENSSTSPRRWRSSGMWPRPASSARWTPSLRDVLAVDDAPCPRRRAAARSSRRSAPSGRCRRCRRCRRSRRRAPRTRRRAPSRSRGRRGRAGPRPRAAARPGSAAVLSTRSSTSRPTISRASPSSVAPSAGSVSIDLPRRSTVIRSAISSTSFSLWRDEDDRLALRGERRAGSRTAPAPPAASAPPSARRGRGCPRRGRAPSGSRRAAAGRR